MKITYLYNYDFIPTKLLEGEDSYNDERKKRIEESINNILEKYKGEFLTHKITYTIHASKGEGTLTFENLNNTLPFYKDIDKELGEIGLKPSNYTPEDEVDKHKETPQTKTNIQDKTNELKDPL